MSAAGRGLPADLLGLGAGRRIAAPLREQITDALRRAILEFRFEPQQRLVERELMELTGVSRTTIREVLRSLEGEGLVKIVPQRGAVVDVPGPQEAAELYEVRATLEALAARRFIAHASDDDLDALVAAHRRYAEAARESPDDILELLRAKDEFYRVLLAGAGSSAVTALLGQLQARVRLLRARSLSRPGRPAETVVELAALVDALAARDPATATALCEHHIDNAAASGREMADARIAATD
ncbi:GntR family transcriptional regulator [Pseudonocardia benzenivorans]|jgi:DNA-binding GntR family transcriptional regulator|uniref:GntR family transcriptional regulator n=1 Tax=Pseudonocardia benzenivorans TaxID=228005 RepID=A0ABW3VSV5_9PSEU|nr:GntR family transcriptional regulator [Pseudonocardia sp. D17]